jgi:hypothetical protein
MNDNAVQAALYLLLMLPPSLFFLAFLTVAFGWLRDPSDQPRWLRSTRSRLLPGHDDDPPSMGGAVFAILSLAFFNFVPVLLLVHNPYGLRTLLVDLLYFAVLGAFLFPVVRAVLRERARSRGR